MFDIGARFLILFGLVVLLVLALTFQNAEPTLASSQVIVQSESIIEDPVYIAIFAGQFEQKDYMVEQFNFLELNKDTNIAF